MPVTEGVVELIFDTMNTSRLEVRWIGEGRKVLFLHGCPTTTDLFDEIMLHRTACDEHMTRDRYAIEMWHFTPSIYPDKQIPFVI